MHHHEQFHSDAILKIFKTQSLRVSPLHSRAPKEDSNKCTLLAWNSMVTTKRTTTKELCQFLSFYQLIYIHIIIYYYYHCTVCVYINILLHIIIIYRFGQHVLANMFRSTCFSQHALAIMFRPTCFSQHVSANMFWASSAVALHLPKCDLIIVVNWQKEYYSMYAHIKN